MEPPIDPSSHASRTTSDRPDRAPVDTVGVRELRNQVAGVLRRVEAGDTVVVTVDGRPVARLSPLLPEGRPTLDDLVAVGLVEPPGRPDRPPAPDAAILPVDVRADRILDEVRR